MPSFHALDRAAAIIKVISFVGSTAYLLTVGKKPEIEGSGLLILNLALVVLGVVLVEGLQIVGLWRHKRWGFGLTAGWYALGFLSGVFLLFLDQALNMRLQPRQLFTWHDMYGLPIAAYCAYRYYTFARFEGPLEGTTE
jgi:hypothetical protein